MGVRTDEDMTRAAREAAFYVQHLRASRTRKWRVNSAADGVADWLGWCATVDLQANPLETIGEPFARFMDAYPKSALPALEWSIWRRERELGHCAGCASDGG